MIRTGATDSPAGLHRVRGLGAALAGLALALGSCIAWPAHAQGSNAPADAPSTQVRLDVLLGRWVRPDGGYMIMIRGVSADGRLEAGYANPSLLPFEKAEATRDGKNVKVFLELRAGGYNGSTYSLTYDPATDVLKGVYFQAVAQQKFDVQFTRVKP